MGMKRLYLQSSKLFLTFFVTNKKGTTRGYRITLTMTLFTLHTFYIPNKLITNFNFRSLTSSWRIQNISANFSSTMSNKSQVDSELYRRYLDNRSVSDSIYFFLIVIHAILMVFGTVGNIVVLLAISMVKSKIFSFFSHPQKRGRFKSCLQSRWLKVRLWGFLHIHRNVAGLSLAHSLKKKDF